MTAPLRDTQLSLVEGMERPVGPLPLSVQTGTNADLIATVAPIYLTGSVLDVTYGRGKWWDRFTPDPFTYHDLHTVDGVDFRDLPHADRSFDTVCFDPPYIPAGGKATNDSGADFRDRFGLATGITMADMASMMVDGLAECARVADRYVIAKCSDFVTSGKFTLGHRVILDAADSLGLTIHDLIVHFAGSGPGNHNITTIKRARRAHSYLLVFAAPKTSVAPLPATDTSAAGAGWLPAPIDPSGQDGSANPASLPVPAADTTDTTKGETR